MPKTWFRPQIDGPQVAETGGVDENDIDKIHKRFLLAIDAVYNSLRPSYNGALDLYEVRKKLKQWISKKIPIRRSLHDGLIYVALDYFYSRRFKSDKDLSLPTPPAQIHFYLRQRRADHMVSNSHLLLSYMTTANLIPAKWVPESLLIDPIEAEIKKLPEFKDVRIDLNLALPPGGKLWIYQNFLENWKKLKDYIDAGRPWPIRLMANTLNPYENKSVIAYGYEDMGNGSGKMYVYDVDCPDREHTINFKLEQNTPTLSESCRQSDDGSDLHGFFCENYTVVPPPQSKVSRFFYSIIPMKSIWYILRFIYLLWLWAKNLV